MAFNQKRSGSAARRRTTAVLLLFGLLLPQNWAFAASQPWRIQLAEGERRLEAQDLPGAEACFQQAVKDVRLSKSRTTDEIVLCMQSLAGVLQMENKTYDVIPLYKKSLKLLEKAHGKDSPRIVRTLILLGDVFENEGDYRVAMRFYSRAVAITQKQAGANSLAFADYTHRLGRAAFQAGLPRKAEELYRTSLTVTMQQQDLPSTTLLYQILSDYTDLYGKAGLPERIMKSEFQEELLKDQLGALEMRKGVSASAFNKEVSSRLADSAGTGKIENGRIVSTTTEPAPASPQIVPDKPMSDFVSLEKINRQRIDFYERMIATDIDSLGANHPSVARDLSGLANIYLTQKKYDSAKPLLERTLAIYQAAYGDDALLVRRTRALLGMIANQTNSTGEEVFVAVDYQQGLPPIPPQAQKLEIALRLNYLAFLAYSHGRVQDAEKFYAWALADTSLSSGEQSPLVAACLTDYERVLRSAGRTLEAERMERNAQSILKRLMLKRAALSYP